MTSPIFWPLLGMLLLGAPGDNDKLRKLYQEGYKAFAAKDHKKAKGAFAKLLPLLEQTQKQKRKPGTRDWHMMTFGQFDVLFHLARIAEFQKQPMRACRYFQRATQRVSTIPPAWKTWKVSPNIPVRLGTAQSKLAQGCQKVPSQLKVTGLPPKATIFLKSKEKKTWTPLKSATVPVLTKIITLKFEAPGFLPKIMVNIPVKRWHTRSVEVKLKKKPKPKQVVVVRPPPPQRRVQPIVPVTRKWWFWTAIGVGVIGAGVITTVAIVNANQPDLLAGQENTAMTIWR